MKFAEGGREGVEGKVRGVHALIAEATHGGNKFLAIQSARVLDTLADDHLGQARATGDGSDAALGPILRVGDVSAIDFEGQDHHVAAGGVFDRDPHVGVFKLANIQWPLEMFEKKWVIHRIDSNRRTTVYSLGMPSLDYLPRRIVSLQPSATVMLRSLNALDRLVACTKYCVDVCPEVAGQALVADSWTAQSEQILAAKPDLVIASVPYQMEAVGEILKAGIPFLGLAPHSLADIYKDLAMIARVVGEEKSGADAMAAMQNDIETVRRKSASLNKKPRVYCEEWGKPMIHSQKWVAELVEAAGGTIVGTPGTHTDAKEIAESDPDVIVMAWCGAGDRVPLTKVVEQRDWSGLRAVRNRKVFCLPDEFLNTPAPTRAEGLHALAGAIHPEAFPAHPRVKQI